MLESCSGEEYFFWYGFLCCKPRRINIELVLFLSLEMYLNRIYKPVFVSDHETIIRIKEKYVKSRKFSG
jgi:hypothetical protein